MEEINEFTLRLRFCLNQRGIGFEWFYYSDGDLNPLMESADEFRIIHPPCD